MSGTLFVVATPIGNLEDLTLRALRTLREVDLIAAEDTRRTAKLLAHYEIRKPLVSLREHNEAKQGARLAADLRAGKQIALVTDAGTPGIADPGARFVRLARQQHIRVVPIPGCSAITTALSGSGCDADQFVFMGFAPPGQRLDDWANDLSDEHRTVVFFDTPHNVARTVDAIRPKLAKRPIIVWRELTKIHEQSIELAAAEHTEPLEAKGEFVVVVGGAEPAGWARATTDWNRQTTELFDYLTKYASISDDVAVKMVAVSSDSPPAAVRKAIKRHRILVKQQTSGAE